MSTGPVAPVQDEQVGPRDLPMGSTPFSTPSCLCAALTARLSAASPAHPCRSPASIAIGIILLLLGFVSFSQEKKKKEKSQAETPSEGIWTISALYLGTKILFACNKKHYLLLPSNKMIPLIFKFQDHTLCL